VTDYAEFVAKKLTRPPATGIEPPTRLAKGLFPFQRDLVRWALKRGRAAIFANTGLGKSRMQLAWADAVRRETKRNVLVLAPLAVAAQTAAEGAEIGVKVTVARDMAGVRPGITITNYERLPKFSPDAFGAVVLDESSCIKHHDAKTLRLLLEAFRETPFRLCLTATPAPNDWTELGTHAEFLGACTRAEMLAEFFVHDGGETQTWRLKKHARAAFWRWVATWAALVRHPRDIGYEEDGYDLPPLNVHEHIVKSGEPPPGFLFVQEAQGLMERRRARRASLADRVRACVDVVAREPAEPWIVWTDLNDESEALTAALDGAVEITGSMPVEVKEQRLVAFAKGEHRVLVSKPSICGFGLNWQHAARMAFVGVTDSWEAYFQAVRRCWRFGQRRPVEVHVFASEAEGGVVANLRRKDEDAAAMSAALALETAEAVRAELRGLERTTNDYAPAVEMTVPPWITTDAPSLEVA
jgi:superfamily II DNA or RNA helicase